MSSLVSISIAVCATGLEAGKYATDMDSSVRVCRSLPTATLPTRATKGAAGWDLYAAEKCEVEARGKALVSTGIRMSIPHTRYGRIAPRSGFSWRNHVDVGAGVIDSDYRGVIQVLLFNHKPDVLKINVGDRIAQIVIEKIDTRELQEVDDLDTTQRGWKGFGSSDQEQQAHA